MSHVYHRDLPGWEPGMLLVDGCPECERRAADPTGALLHLDDERTLAAWRLMRAVKWSDGDGVDRPLSRCEDRLLSNLYGFAVFLQRGGMPPAEVERRLEMRMLELRCSTGVAGVEGTLGRDAMRWISLQQDLNAEIVDRVAAAIADAQEFDWEHLPEKTGPDGDLDRAMFREQARAAIGALPVGTML